MDPPTAPQLQTGPESDRGNDEQEHQPQDESALPPPMDREAIQAMFEEIMSRRLAPLHRNFHLIPTLHVILEYSITSLEHMEASDLSEHAPPQSIAQVLETICNDWNSVVANRSAARDLRGHHYSTPAREDYFTEDEDNMQQVRRQTTRTARTKSQGARELHLIS